MGSTAGATWRYRRNRQGDITASKDPDGHTTHIRYTAQGQPAMVVQPDRSITRYHYHPSGLLKRLEPPVGQPWNFHYDDQNRLVARTDDEGNRRRWLYQDDSDQPHLGGLRRWHYGGLHL